VSGFSWSEDGKLVWPEKVGTSGNGAATNVSAPSWWSSRNPYTVKKDIADLLGEYS